MSKYKVIFLIHVLFFFSLTSGSFAQIPAFPGAEGYGSQTPGGRGGQVYVVTNLNQIGSGSLREAIEASGPRIVVFALGGTIVMTDFIKVKNPYITIAGQTAPGDGIMLRGGGLSIRTHDVIVRGLTIRVGDHPAGPSDIDRDGIHTMGSDAHNIVVDHCSLSWSVDKNATHWDKVTNVTWSWNFIGEALWHSIHYEFTHSRNFMVGDHCKEISIHHNLMIHSNRRHPFIKGNTTTEVVNNVIYNWGARPCYFKDTDGSGALFSNVIANFGIPGLNTPSGSHFIQFATPLHSDTRVYLQGNKGPYRVNDSDDEWLCASGTILEQFKATSPAVPESGITTYTAEKARDLVLQHAGARIPNRDPIDIRWVQDVQNALSGNPTGSFVDCVESSVCDPGDVQVPEGGWPDYASGTPLKDSDSDGIPDSWETANGLTLNVYDANGRDLDPNYDNIEVYINSLIPNQFDGEYYSLIVNVKGSGSVSPAEGSYVEGKVIILTATPLGCNQFDGWSGDLTGSDNPETITMDADKSVTASFSSTPGQKILTVNTSGNGTVDLIPSGGSYPCSTIVTLTACPNSGNVFNGWSGDLSGDINPLIITMDHDKTVTASFGAPATEYQAEDAIISQGAVQNEHAGYTGTGYVNYNNVNGSYIEFSVEVLLTGSYDLSIRYANAKSQDQDCPMDIIVNETTIANHPFENTGAWTNWDVNITHGVPLNVGTNTIRATATSPSGGPNVDKLEIGDETAIDIADKTAPKIPDKIDLLNCFPNPFNPSTNILYTLSRESWITLEIYNITGCIVVTLENNVKKPVGRYTYQWEAIDAYGRQIPSGIYFCRLQADSYVKTTKILFLQ